LEKINATGIHLRRSLLLAGAKAASQLLGLVRKQILGYPVVYSVPYTIKKKLKDICPQSDFNELRLVAKYLSVKPYQA
jgi:hypothetical protein